MGENQNFTDSLIILQCKDGNTSQLSILVSRYHKVFCERAYWITQDKEIAKDIAQESWVVILNNLNSLKNVDSFKSWAFRIVYNKSIDAVKQLNKVNNIEAQRVFEYPTQSLENDNNQTQLTLLKAIRELSKEKQDILRLFYTEEYSLKEISSFLKIPIGTVKSRLFKAREKLKSILKN